MEHSQVTLSILLERFDAAFPDQEAGTIYMRHLAFAQLIAVCGDLALGDFGIDDAEAYRAALIGGFRPATIEQVNRLNQLPPRARKGFEKGFTPVTAAAYLKMVRPPFLWVQIKDRVFYDHWSGLRRIKVPKKPSRVYSDQKLGDLLAAARKLADAGLAEARVIVMVTAGLRRAEGQHLIDDDIDWDGGAIVVQPHDETATTFAWVPKDDECRRVPLVKEARDILLQRREQLPQGQPYLLLSAERYAYLMCLRALGQLTDRMRKCPDENWRPWKRIRRQAGTTGLSQKHLRSTFATNALRDGVDLRSVQEMMGHSDIKTTQGYIPPDASAIEKASQMTSARLDRIRLRTGS